MSVALTKSVAEKWATEWKWDNWNTFLSECRKRKCGLLSWMGESHLGVARTSPSRSAARVVISSALWHGTVPPFDCSCHVWRMIVVVMLLIFFFSFLAFWWGAEVFENQLYLCGIKLDNPPLSFSFLFSLSLFSLFLSLSLFRETWLRIELGTFLLWGRSVSSRLTCQSFNHFYFVLHTAKGLRHVIVKTPFRYGHPFLESYKRIMQVYKDFTTPLVWLQIKTQYIRIIFKGFIFNDCLSNGRRKPLSLYMNGVK